MTVGDIVFVAAFIVLPLLIIAWSLMTLRSIRRRRAMLSTAMTTQELPVIAPPRDWAASVQAARSRTANHAPSAAAPARHFWPPAYRGRAAGTVRRVTPPAARWPAAHRRPARDAAIVAARRR